MGSATSLAKRLAAYSAAVGAVCAVGGTAEAVPVSYNFGPTGITGTAQNGYILSLDLAGDVTVAPPNFTPGTADQFAFANSSSFLSDSLRVNAQGKVAAVMVSSKGWAAQLSHSNAIGPLAKSGGVAWGTSGRILHEPYTFNGHHGSWAPGERGYLGLRFDDAGTELYGWADVRMNGYDSVTLYGYGYEDSGAPTGAGHVAGVIPEPSTLALLSMGVAGLAAFRRRRRERGGLSGSSEAESDS